MKIKSFSISIISLLLLSSMAFSQDKRTLETKIADLLAQLPASDVQYTDKLMGDMLSLGEEGIKKICDQIILPGTGDDTKPRFAVESFSRYLSQKSMENEKSLWEDICISYISRQNDNLVKDFFMKQLQLIGEDKSVEALKPYITDKQMCNSAVAVITAIGGKPAENVLAGSLENMELPCAAAVMNALAAMNSQIAVNEYISWASVDNPGIKASAYNALAQSRSTQAYPVLLNAAKNNQYRWEKTGATSALLNYARNAGAYGDTKTMDRICKLLIKKCNDKLTFQNKTAALETYVMFHGSDAMSYILKAAAHPDAGYRNAAINTSAYIMGNEATDTWIKYFPKAIPAAKPEIINMLGRLGDEKALPLIKASLIHEDPAVRGAAAQALIKADDKEAIPLLIGYMMEFESPSDQDAALTALKSLTGSKEMPLIKNVLEEGLPAAKKSAIELLARGKNTEFFKVIFPYTSAADEEVRAAAFKALASLAGPEDQDELVSLLLKSENEGYVSDIQNAIAVAAGQIPDPEKRSLPILKALASGEDREKLIPVLAKTRGRDALAVVLKEFENGTSGIRQICFNTLTSWNDYSASSALYEICASGNKTYEEPSFNGYVRQIRSASLPDEQKLLLYRKIMSYALTPERKNAILGQMGRLKTYQSLFFVAHYLDDPLTASVAARAAMNIALPASGENAGMYGSNVKEILEKAMLKLQDQESDYDREMIRKYLETMPDDEGFVPMFNSKDLTGWQGLVEDPAARAEMKPAELARKQAEADKRVSGNWTVKDGCIWFNGSGDNLCSIKEYGDFELLVDWKISKGGDSGIYLRGSPQVQIWDISRVEAGAQVGSGGLYNNQKNTSKPLKVADNPIGEWNTFRIIMIGENVSIWLNGELVVDNVIMENYWDRSIPIFPKGAIELQAHGTDLGFRDIYVREINEKEYNLTPEEKAEGFVSLFNGSDLDNWTGDKVSYAVEDGDIAEPGDNGTMDHRDHPGLRNKTGHIGFLGHGSVVKFRNIRIKDLSVVN